ncbi:MAG: hypothetical protein JWQ74_3255 [Marmoricola sp.]|nr:hypothetical protein [Marmoricola sp.]
MIRAIRWSFGGLGVLVGLFGAKLLLDLGGANLFAAAKWLIGGVVAHDAVAGPATILVAFLAVRLVRGKVPAPVIVGFVVLATVTVTAWPVLGRFGARPDNPTLLDRNYTVGWLVLAGVTVLLVVVALVRDRRTATGGRRGTRTRG